MNHIASVKCLLKGVFTTSLCALQSYLKRKDTLSKLMTSFKGHDNSVLTDVLATMKKPPF